MRVGSLAIAGECVFLTKVARHCVVVTDLRGLETRAWGSWGAAPGEFTDPRGIAVANGVVFVSDKHRIQAFRKDGRFLRTWGEYGSAASQFNDPGQLALSPYSLFVMDDLNERVQAFTHEGTFLFLVSTRNQGRWLCSLAVSDNELFTVTHERNVHVWDAQDGTFLRRFCVQGSGNTCVSLGEL
jgi:hypothetical protein